MKRFFISGHWRTALFLFVALGLTLLVVEGIAEKGVSLYNKILALCIALACVIVFIRVKQPGGIQPERHVEPDKQAELLNLFFAVFGVISAAMGLMAPRPTVEDRPGLIQSALLLVLDNTQQTLENSEILLEGQNAIADALGAGTQSLAIQHIGGRWGEERCASTYDFTLQDRALIVQSVKDAPGLEPMKWVFTIISDGNRPGASGEKLSVIEAAEVEGFIKSQSVTFTYATNGVTERLTWDGRDPRQNTHHLGRC
jgi:hypothetical protein